VIEAAPHVAAMMPRVRRTRATPNVTHENTGQAYAHQGIGVRDRAAMSSKDLGSATGKAPRHDLKNDGELRAILDTMLHDRNTPGGAARAILV